MFKKALSLLLALMLIVTSLSVTLVTVAAAGDEGDPQEEVTFIVAGSPAEIFGTVWDGANADNTMTAQDDGTFSKTYTVTKAYRGVQVKAVKNGADWFGDETGNNVTFNLTEAGDFTVTVTPVDDSYVVSVAGDIVQFDTTLDYDCIYAVGNGEGTWLNDASWDPGFLANEMAETEPGIWEISFENVSEGFDRQVKFAIDGAWTHNFGGTFVDFDSETEAVYNGDNITFDTEYESQTVKLKLDMTEFDFSSKEGAKFTVNVVPNEEPDESTVPDETNDDESTTAAQTTEKPEEDTTSETPTDGETLTVTAESNLFPTTVSTFTQEDLDATNGLVTVTYFIQSDMQLVNSDWLLTYDGNVLEFNLDDNMVGEGRNSRLNIMPNSPDAVINDSPVSVEYGIKGNCTNLRPYYLDAEDGSRTAFVTVTFKAKGTGDTTVRLDVSEMRVTDLPDGQTQSQTENETQLVENGTVLDNGVAYTASTAVYSGPYDEDYEEPTAAPTTEEPTTEEPTTEEATTEEATTEEPTTEEATSPAPETIFVVAGNPAEIFGTAWDATNTDNTMTANDDGTFTKTYTVTKAFTDVQLKAVDVNNNAWYGDQTGNNVTFNLTGAGEFTVTATPDGFGGYIVSVSGDMVEEPTVPDYIQVFAAGNGEGAWLNDASWDPAFLANEMTEVADHLLEISYENVGEGFDRQLKFALYGSWTYNFGGTFVESGVETDAVFNGDNITFDTEYESQTVKIQLDLREFDFVSKTGAKFTITITDEGEAEETTAPETTTAPPAEDTTAEPTTEESTTPVSQDAFTVKATSNFFPESSNTYYNLTELEDGNGDVYVVVEYKLLGENKKLVNVDIDELTWDPSVLEYKEEYNTVDSTLNFFSFASENGYGEGVVNTFNNANGGRIVGNYTAVSPAPYAYNEDNSPVTAVKAIFKVLDRTAGETTVNCLVDTVSLCDEDVEDTYAQYIPVDSEVINASDYEKASYTTVISPDAQDAPEGTTSKPEETTEKPQDTTEEPQDTTAEDTTSSEPSDTFLVAGSPADIFGTAWDAANTDNLMDAQPDGTFTKTYTVTKEFSEVQLKGVKNGADWYGDATGNNVTFNLTGPGEFTVIATPDGEDGYVMSVAGDIVEVITTFDYESVNAVGNGEGTWLNGLSWDPGAQANKMNKVSDDLWEIEFTNVGEGFDRQIKFAIDGAWTHNFGGAFVESGVETDAVYNGDNITFDTEFEAQTVKAVLDLRNFDYVSKTGAKFTITITEEGETEETTAPESTTTPETTVEPSGKLNVTGVSNYCPTVNVPDVNVGDTVTVNFAAPEDLTIVNIQFGIDYDNDKLELSGVETFTNEIMVNDHATSHDIIGNVSNIDGISFENGQNLVSVSFVAKAAGETEVALTIIDMSEKVDDGDEPYYVDGVNVREQPEPTTTVEPEETTEEATTEETTTEETTTEESTAPAPETIFVVAGSPADIFGTAWDATNTDNTMTANPDGSFTKTYTVDKAFTDVQLKAVDVNNNDWYGDETGNNVIFNLTDAGEFTVTATPTDDNKYVVSVAGDNVQVITTFNYESVYAVGNGDGAWLNGAAWDPGYIANKMDKVADDLWKIEFTNVGEGFDRQIKFAIDGAWTHNFGGAFADSDVETDAVYNGDNITFDTEFEAQTVKAVLDLRDFDFVSKTGAKFTITITEEGETEETTAEPEQTTEPPVEDTTAESTTVEPTTEEPTPVDKLSVSGTSNYCPAIDAREIEVGESIIMNFLAPEDLDIVDIQWGLTYDKELLELTASDYFTGSMLANHNAKSYNSMGNVTDLNGIPVTAGDTFASFTFKVKAVAGSTGKAGDAVGASTGGETVVDFKVIDMSAKTGETDEPIFVNGVDQRSIEEPTTVAPEDTTAEPTTEEVTTEEPTTEEPTTERPADSLGVSGTSNYCDSVPVQIVKNGDSVTVTFKAPEDVNIIDLQWSVDYDNELLELTGIETFTPDMLINNNAETHDALGSVANIDNPYSVAQGDDFVSFTFNAKGEGDTEVVFNVVDMSVKTDDGEETYFADSVDVRDTPEEPTTEGDSTEESTTEEVTTEESTTEEATTEEPTTEEPTTERPADSLGVSGTSNYCDAVPVQIVKNGDSVTVTFKAPEDVNIIDLQWSVDYDNELLELTGIETFTPDMLINNNAESHDALGSVANIDNPYSVAQGDDFVSFTFNAKGEGDTEVVFNVVDMSVKTDDGEETYFADSVDVRDTPEEPTTEEETTEEATTEEATTEEPTTEEPTTEEPTTEEPTTERPADSLSVSGTSNYCDNVPAQIVKNGDSVTVTFKAPEDVNIIDLQWSVDYDNELLELTGIETFTPDMLINNNAETHDALGSVANIDNPYSVAQGDDFVSFTFNAKGEGDTEVVFNVVDMSVKTDDGEETYFADGEDVRETPEQPTTEEPTTEEVTTEESTTEEVTTEESTTEEVTTEESTTEEVTTEESTTVEGTTEEPTTEAPLDKLTVSGISNYCDSVPAQSVDPSQTVTVTFKAPEDVNILNFQWTLNYDNDLLQLTSIETFTNDMSINQEGDENNDAMGSVSNLNPYSVAKDSTLVSVTFTAKDAGTTQVDFRVVDMTVMTDDGEKVYFADGVDVREQPEPSTSEPGTSNPEPSTSEPGTSNPEPGTSEPGTSNPEPGTSEPGTSNPEPDTTVPVTTEEVTTEPVTTEEVTTEPVTTEEVTTEPVTTEEVTTEPVTTEEVTTEPVTTEEVTTEPETTVPGTSDSGEEEEEEGYIVVFGDGTTAQLEKDENGNYKIDYPVDGEEEEVEFKIVKVNPDGSQEDVTDMQKVKITGDGTLNINFDPDTNNVETKFTPTDEGETTKPGGDQGSTDATSSTSNVSTPDNPDGNNPGAVQTGNVSMALIILLILVSATAGVYFARKKQK